MTIPWSTAYALAQQHQRDLLAAAERRAWARRHRTARGNAAEATHRLTRQNTHANPPSL